MCVTAVITSVTVFPQVQKLVFLLTLLISQAGS